MSIPDTESFDPEVMEKDIEILEGYLAKGQISEEVRATLHLLKTVREYREKENKKIPNNP